MSAISCGEAEQERPVMQSISMLAGVCASILGDEHAAHSNNMAIAPVFTISAPVFKVGIVSAATPAVKAG